LNNSNYYSSLRNVTSLFHLKTILTLSQPLQIFKVCGPITCVRLAVWGNTKQLKGFGYVDFKREDSAEIAVKKSGVLVLKGRPVIIDFETGAPKQSFRKLDGKVWTKNDSQSQLGKRKKP
jgi:nucleolin